MLIDIITESLKTTPRIVVPQLGAFIKKENSTKLLFLSLLREDDGVLRAIVSKSCNSELEAAGKIDRFVFEVRHALNEGGKYPLGELGELRLGANGNIILAPAPSPEVDLLDEVANEAPMEAAAIDIVSVPAESEDSQIDNQQPLTEPEPVVEAEAEPAHEGVDMLLVVAIIAMIIAFAAIGYGFMGDSATEFNLFDDAIEWVQQMIGRLKSIND